MDTAKQYDASLKTHPRASYAVLSTTSTVRMSIYFLLGSQINDL